MLPLSRRLVVRQNSIYEEIQISATRWIVFCECLRVQRRWILFLPQRNSSRAVVSKNIVIVRLRLDMYGYVRLLVDKAMDVDGMVR